MANWDMLSKDVSDWTTSYVWTTRSHFNILDEKETEEYFNTVKDTLTVHLAAYTATSRAEIERNECYDSNVVGTRKDSMDGD